MSLPPFSLSRIIFNTKPFDLASPRDQVSVKKMMLEVPSDTGYDHIWNASKISLPSPSITQLCKWVLQGLLCISNMTCFSSCAESL